MTSMEKAPARSPMAHRPPPGMGSMGRRDDSEVTEWLRKAFARGQLDRLVLYQMLKQDGRQQVAEWGQDDMAGKDPEELFQDIMEQAGRDAKFARGEPRYGIYAYHPDEDKHFQRYYFRMPGGEDDFGGDGDFEAPDTSGVTSMLMRHTDSAVRMSLASMNEIIRTLERQLREHASQMQRMGQVHFQVLELQQKMMDRQGERDLAIRKQDAEEKRKAQMFEKLAVLWPIAAKKIFGVEGKDVGQMLGEEQLGGILEGLSTEQITSIAGSLNDAQRASFFELYKAYKARKAHNNGDGPDPSEKKKSGATA